MCRVAACKLARCLLMVASGLLAQTQVAAQSAASATHSTIAATRAYVRANERAILAEFVEFLSLPNDSRNPEDIGRNARRLVAMMEHRGARTRTLQAPGGAPLVYGEITVPNASTTLVFYAHYDGQPTDSREWSSPPFEPVLRAGKVEEGASPVVLSNADRLDPQWRLYARSAADDKAAIVAMLWSLDALRSTNIPLRTNIKFVFDGEEEAGSGTLGQLLRSNQDLFSGDVWIICDGPVHRSGKRTAVLGVRGVQPLELTVYGATHALHSGHYGSWAPNPGMMLAQLLGTMMDADGRITIKGFTEAVPRLSAAELEAVRELSADDVQEMHDLGLARTLGGGKSRAELNATLPAINVDGLLSGKVGADVVNAIPAEATASLDLRLPKGLERDRALRLFIDHVRRQGYFVTSTVPDLTTRQGNPRIARIVVDENGYNGVRMPVDHPVAKRVLRALRGGGESVVLIPSYGSSAPLATIEETLGAPTLTVPIANPDNNQHAKDENLRLGYLWRGIETMALLMSME